MKFRLLKPIMYFPIQISDAPVVLDAGAIVFLVRRCTATLFRVRAEHAADPADTTYVSASEVEECLNVHTLSHKP